MRRPDSLMSDQPVAVLCVPLIMLERTLGVIYLDTKEPDTLFDKDHLQLVSAISAITAVAIENARHIEWLVSENQRLIADFNIEHNLVGESPPIREVLQFISKRLRPRIRRCCFPARAAPAKSWRRAPFI